MTELKIIMDDSGRISVTGPIEDRVLCYGMLEVARDAVKNHADKAKSALLPATAVDLAALRQQQ